MCFCSRAQGKVNEEHACLQKLAMYSKHAKELTYSTKNKPVITLLAAAGASSKPELTFLNDIDCADENLLDARIVPRAAERGDVFGDLLLLLPPRIAPSGDVFGDLLVRGDKLRCGGKPCARGDKLPCGAEGLPLDDPETMGFEARRAFVSVSAHRRVASCSTFQVVSSSSIRIKSQPVQT